ncbi:PEP-CTERM sorting domain-containing protein [Candidatus Nitrosacidococcus tergens]|uniref:Ice-binding protein C-terminal domain-containing protein n=1 Tax=Candidatus Nitrosacidococcus tergens TaxID=553981 RepID=A0A7G1QA42_9GAMM|nr:PEP-CTERM sorting domain-containing protein [Candidatus Nitrosacidococcus tergens]CAB1276408.1 protein of unknown function [Candidatus Nitrosacidococcus tergens]
MGIILSSFKKWLLSLVVMAIGFFPFLATAGPMSFNISGQAQYFLSDTNNNPVSTNFTGTMTVDPTGLSQNFGEIGQITAIAFNFPDLSIPVFDTITTQDPLVAQIDEPLAYNVNLKNANNETASLSFTTPNSSGTLFGTQFGSLTSFSGGTIFQGQTDTISTASGDIILQNFTGTITPSNASSVPEPATLGIFSLGLLFLSVFMSLRPRMQISFFE